ncbi:MAG: hypothetical protein OCD02_05485 [Spirochaetaceae bacterium]
MKIFKITSIFRLIYIAVIITLLYLFFSGKEIHSYNIDGLDIKETSSIDFPLIPKRIKSLELTYKGLSFYLSKKNVVTVISDDDIIRSSNIEDLSIMDNSVQVNLENSISLIFRVDNYGERLTISSNIPRVFPNIKELYIPYTLVNNYELNETELSYVISNENQEFHLKVNDKYFVNQLEKRIHLTALDDKVSTLTFSQLDDSDLPIAEQWYIEQKKLEKESLAVLLENYLSKIDDGINQVFGPIRYVPKNDTNGETWKNIPSLNKFSENSIIVYLAKAMLTGNYTNSLKKIKGIKSRYPNILTYNSTPFLGNVVRNGNKGMSLDKKELTEIKRQIKSGDNKILQSQIPLHYFEAGEIEITTLEKIINEIDKKNLNLTELSNSLYHLIQILDMGTINSISSDSIKQITDLIIQNIKWDDSGIYLVNNEDISSQLLNLKTGKLLIEASQHETSEYSKPIGEALIQTYMNNSDNLGSNFTFYNFKEKTYSQEIIKAEDSYLLLSQNRYLPHYYQSNGIKIWTISDSIVINRSSKDTRITITYPLDKYTKVNSHFLIISGIKPYKSLNFKGTAWRADKNFEKWGIGYYYEPSTQLLYFMPNHTKLREEIVVYY